MGEVVVAPGVRWFRRRPPAGTPRFAGTVWWAGHAQLFVAAGFAVLGPLLFAVGLLVSGWGGAVGTGVLLFAMAPPFACSGLMLRRFAPHLAADRSSLFFRVLELALVVLAIAVLSIAFVFVDMFLLIFLGYGFTVGR